MGATENLLDTGFAAEARFSAGLVGIRITLVHYCLPPSLLIFDMGVLNFSKIIQAFSKKWVL